MQPRSDGGGWTRRKAIGAFVVVSVLPLVLLAGAVVGLATDAVRDRAQQEVTGTAQISAVAVVGELQGLLYVLASYAARPQLVDALADGTVDRTDRATIGRHLEQLGEAHRAIHAVGLVGVDGRVLQGLPGGALVGTSVADQEWYLAASTAGTARVSDVLEVGLTGPDPGIAVTAVVRTDDGRPLGVVLAAVTTASIEQLADRFAAAQGVTLILTDAAGTVVAATGDAVPASLADDPDVAAALGGLAVVGEREGPDGSVLSATVPVDDIGWTVTAEVTTAAALADLSGLRRTVLLVAGVLTVVLLAGLALVLLAQSARGRAEDRLAGTQARLEAVIEAADEAFITIDRSGRITSWNPEAERTFGWPAAEAIGRDISETIIPEELREAHRTGLQRFLSTRTSTILRQRIEVPALHREGHQFPLELAIWPVETEQGWMFHALAHDVSARKEQERQLAEARDAAMEASRLKSQFLANMSHEIRTPMNGIIGMTALLLGTELDAEQRDYAQTVRGSGEALLTIINDILDFSKIEAGKIDFEVIDFDLRTAVEDVAELLADVTHAKGLALATLIHPDVPLAVRGDPGRLRQVLMNLVGNAVKFTEEGEVVIRVRLVEQRTGSRLVAFEVADTGIGIALEHQRELFQPFQQADASTTRRYGGTGLGLAISRQLVELMGGELSFSSTPGEGSTFSFTASFGTAQGDAVGQLVRRSDLAGLKVLVVDDNATNRAVVEQLLASWGMTAEPAASAAQALALLWAAAAAGQPYAVAILDMQMPGMDGLELARRISDEPTLRVTRLVLLTSSAQRNDARAAREAGIAGYLTKPVRASQLQGCLAAVTGAPDVDTLLVTRHSLNEAERRDRIHVLVVEDDPVNQKVAARTLEKLGYRVDVAGDGVEGVAAVLRTRYAVVLMDTQMPNLDGFGATAQIRALDGDAARVPIVAMTAAAMSGDRERCLAAGMDDYISKPFAVPDLRGLVERWAGAPPGRESDAEVVVAASLAATSGADPLCLDPGTVASLQKLTDAEGQSVLAGLVELYAGDLETRLPDAAAACAAGDVAAVAMHMHRVRGASGNLGALPLMRQCAALEEATLDGELPPDAAEQIGEITAQAHRVVLALRQLAAPTSVG